METKKQLYPLKFIPIASKRVWGGNQLINKLGKSFVEVDADGNETTLTTSEAIGESWEIADMGEQDSVVSEGWLAGNTISEIMETYMDRIVGEHVYNWYGNQFPLLIKFLDIQDRLSVQVHPDDKVAEERYDSLGKCEIWYIMDAQPGAKIYAGFKKKMTAQELYERCKNGTVDEVLNVIEPRKGDAIFIKPGTVHAADKGLLVAEIQESSDLTFRLYDWGREFNPATARKTHLDEAIDLIDYNEFNPELWIKGDAWKEECSCGCGHEHEHEHEHEHKIVRNLATCPEFTANLITLTDPLHIYTEKFGSFIIYICTEGAAAIQVGDQTYNVSKGESVLIPADMPDFYLTPRDRETVLFEAIIEKREEVDDYIDPSTEPFLEGEDYEGLEDECDCEDEHVHEHGCSCGCHHHHES